MYVHVGHSCDQKSASPALADEQRGQGGGGLVQNRAKNGGTPFLQGDFPLHRRGPPSPLLNACHIFFYIREIYKVGGGGAVRLSKS